MKPHRHHLAPDEFADAGAGHGAAGSDVEAGAGNRHIADTTAQRAPDAARRGGGGEVAVAVSDHRSDGVAGAAESCGVVPEFLVDALPHFLLAEGGQASPMLLLLGLRRRRPRRKPELACEGGGAVTDEEQVDKERTRTQDENSHVGDSKGEEKNQEKMENEEVLLPTREKDQSEEEKGDDHDDDDNGDDSDNKPNEKSDSNRTDSDAEKENGTTTSPSLRLIKFHFEKILLHFLPTPIYVHFNQINRL